MVARKFTVLLQPAEEGGFIVKCLELPVASQVETRDEALKNIKEAIEGYLEAKTKISGRKAEGDNIVIIPSTSPEKFFKEMEGCIKEGTTTMDPMKLKKMWEPADKPTA